MLRIRFRSDLLYVVIKSGLWMQKGEKTHKHKWLTGEVVKVCGPINYVVQSGICACWSHDCRRDDVIEIEEDDVTTWIDEVEHTKIPVRDDIQAKNS